MEPKDYYEEPLVLALSRQATGATVHKINNFIMSYQYYSGQYASFNIPGDVVTARIYRDALRMFLSGRVKDLQEALITAKVGFDPVLSAAAAASL